MTSLSCCMDFHQTNRMHFSTFNTDTHLNAILLSKAFFCYDLFRWWTIEVFSVFFLSFIKTKRWITCYLWVMSLVISFHGTLDLFEWRCFWFGELETKPSFSAESRRFVVYLFLLLSSFQRCNYYNCYYCYLDWVICAYFSQNYCYLTFMPDFF